MFQQFSEPHPALKGFVNNVMIHHMTSDVAQPQPNFSIPPLPEHGSFFYLRDSSDAEKMGSNEKETLSSSIIVGPNTNRHIMTPGRNHLMIKVGFQTGGLYRLLGIPMNDLLCNNALNGMIFFGKEINEVNEKLQEAVSFTEMKWIVENFLLKRKGKLKQVLPIVSINRYLRVVR